jgi:hypothetical protein
MMWLKGCPKCHGDLYESRDHYGGYVTCLQCGHHLSGFEEFALGIILSTVPLAETIREAAPDLVASAS